MAILDKEREAPPAEVKTRAEEIEVPPELEEAGVEARPENFTAQVEKGGQPLIKTSQNQAVTVQIPADPQTVQTWAKGPVVDSLTWLAKFWLRIIKKAGVLGQKIVFGK